MADISQFMKNYHDFNSTFKESSFDSENCEYVCNDESQEVINFDKIIESKYPDSNSRPKSFDAMYRYNNIIFCIEFKNQKPSQIDNLSVQEKIIDGKAELDKLLQEFSIQIKDYDFVYCVAYKKCVEPRDRYKCGIDKGKILFGLEKYKQESLVKDIFTNNVEFFTKEFKKRLQKELEC